MELTIDTEQSKDIKVVLLESGRNKLLHRDTLDGADCEELSGTVPIKGEVEERYSEDVSLSVSKRKFEKTGKNVTIRTYTRKGEATIQVILEVVNLSTSRPLTIKVF